MSAQHFDSVLFSFLVCLFFSSGPLNLNSAKLENVILMISSIMRLTFQCSSYQWNNLHLKVPFKIPNKVFRKIDPCLSRAIVSLPGAKRKKTWCVSKFHWLELRGWEWVRSVEYLLLCMTRVVPPIIDLFPVMSWSVNTRKQRENISFIYDEKIFLFVQLFWKVAFLILNVTLDKSQKGWR